MTVTAFQLLIAAGYTIALGSAIAVASVVTPAGRKLIPLLIAAPAIWVSVFLLAAFTDEPYIGLIHVLSRAGHFFTITVLIVGMAMMRRSGRANRNLREELNRWNH